VDANPFNLLGRYSEDEDVPNFIQSWLPLQSVVGSVQVKFGIGCHKTWREDYETVPEEARPTHGDKATKVLDFIPSLKSR
jgi:hypothetical protein